ncbi:dihydroorotase [Candidatus Synechococcus calcipolaris G9]|uniref:Dihydroorotase n=1 Tax=Candidatus Synechococcus calcipolaris G9 TaxID=1497997 RepID=A0ABT6EZK4_9SYNE|nr:dihydroorotase [Candidatus Synechococcus calcipolaris]MDG2991005.1 dihydroorotase [Candidatus Synechococcus calcipolaris G9]
MVVRLLQQVRILDPVNQRDVCGDVLLDDRSILAIAPHIDTYPDETYCQNAQGLILGPGLVDLYSHSGEPGYEYRETLASLVAAAAAGGFSRIHLLPDTQPAIDGPAVWQQIQAGLSQNAQNSRVQVGAWAGLTQNLGGTALNDLAELAASGIVGFSDSRGLTHWPLLQRALEYLQPFNRPVALWPFDSGLGGQGVMRQSPEAVALGLVEQGAIAETGPLAMILELAATVELPIHVMRLSTARSVEMMEQVYAQGQAPAFKPTASVSWLHLLLNTTDLGSYDPNLRLDPPLGTPRDQQALIAGVKSGAIAAIAIDHTPLTYEEKMVSFAEALPGAIGLELALPCLWQQLVTTEQLTALELWQALSTRPAEILGQTPAQLVPGQPSEVILFDPNPVWTVTADALHSHAQNTPFLGKTLQGKVVTHLLYDRPGD